MSKTCKSDVSHTEARAADAPSMEDVSHPETERQLSYKDRCQLQFADFRDKKSKRESMCIDDSADHPGETTRERVAQLSGSEAGDDGAAMDLERGPTPAISPDPEGDSSKPEGEPGAPNPGKAKATPWYKDKSKLLCYGNILLPIIAVAATSLFFVRRSAAASRSAKNAAAEKWMKLMGKKMAEGTIAGLEEAVECGRFPKVYCNGEIEEDDDYPIHKMDATREGIQLDILVPDMTIEYKLTKIEYLDEMGAKATLEFDDEENKTKSGFSMEPKLVKHDMNDPKFVTQKGQDKPDNWSKGGVFGGFDGCGFIQCATRRHSFRALLTKSDTFPEADITEDIGNMAPEIIFENLMPESSQGKWHGYINLSNIKNREVIKRYRRMDIHHFLSELKGLVWESNTDSFTDKACRWLLKGPNDRSFKNNLTFELVKNKHMWNKLAIYNIKVRNTKGNSCERADTGVMDIALFNNREKREIKVQRLYKRVRHNGSFYLVFYCHNATTDKLEEFDEIRYRTGARASNPFGGHKWASWADPKSCAGILNIAKNQDIVVRFLNDKMHANDAGLVEMEKTITENKFEAMKVIVRVPGIGGEMRSIECQPLRIDVHDVGTHGAGWNITKWGDDRKIGIVVDGEKLPTDISYHECLDRIERIEHGSYTWNVGIKTQETNMCFTFVKTLEEFIKVKWNPGHFKERFKWKKVLAWGAAGGLAVVGGVVLAAKLTKDAATDTAGTLISAATK